MLKTVTTIFFASQNILQPVLDVWYTSDQIRASECPVTTSILQMS